MLSDHARKQKARQDTHDLTGSEKGGSDEDNDNQKQSARTSPTLRSNKKVEDRTQSPAEHRAVLTETEGQLVRAERQVRAISKTKVADTFLEGQVCTWTKETLWKMCKFIMNYQTMHKVMHKASKHFKVPAPEQEHWVSSYAHIVRDELNQKRNVCS
jgi:ribosome-binding protein aMBF1 (putative translation factor)